MKQRFIDVLLEVVRIAGWLYLQTCRAWRWVRVLLELMAGR